MYHPQLDYCVIQFLEKDPTLATEVSLVYRTYNRIVLTAVSGCPWDATLLAQDQQCQRSDVPQRARKRFGCHQLDGFN